MLILKRVSALMNKKEIFKQLKLGKTKFNNQIRLQRNLLAKSPALIQMSEALADPHTPFRKVVAKSLVESVGVQV